MRVRRAFAKAWWRIVNPLTIPFAGLAPWWVLLETTGRRTGRLRRVPLARGPVDGRMVWLVAVHGAHAGFAHNIAARPEVRVKMRGRWRSGTASLHPFDPEMIRSRFNLYARLGPLTLGFDPALVRVDLDE